MNSKILISFLVGLILGGGGVYLRQHGRESADGVKTRLARLETELAQKQIEITNLQKHSPAKVEPEQTEVSAAQAAAAEQQMAKARADMDKQRQKMKERLEGRLTAKVEEQLVVLKKKLGLNDDQVETVRTLLMEKMKKGDFGFNAYAAMSEESDGNGPKNQEKEMLGLMLDPQKQDRALDEKILSLLTPDQQAAYAAHKQEQRANKVEMAANKELAKLQGAMSLSAEQKDQIFGALSQFADQEHDNPIMGMVAMIEKQPNEIERIKKDMGDESARQILDQVEELKQRQARRREALKPILSDEQMKVYENIQQASAFDMSEMMGDMGMEMMIMGSQMDTEAEPPSGAVEVKIETTPAAPAR